MLYIVPEQDTLISISESNCKVWDLTYDEATFNMNEHKAPIICCKLCPTNS